MSSFRRALTLQRGVKALQRKLAKDTHVRKWHFIDAKDQVVGRLASSIAPLLTGKYRPDYSPHYDTGDYVVVRSPVHECGLFQN